jgi:hypothetical protein
MLSNLKRSKVINLLVANHTNRELELMLSGRKPLAFFCDEVSQLPQDEIIPEVRFAPHVASGRFVRGEETFAGDFHLKLGRVAQLKYVFFAIAKEAWRRQALALLLRVRYRMNSFQSEDMERMEGMLLGYTDEKIDAWCDHRFR